MRWVVIALILINAAYFVGQQIADAPIVPTVSSAIPEKSLRLASEVAVASSDPVVTAAVEPSSQESTSDDSQSEPEQGSGQQSPNVEAKKVPPVQESFKACYSIGPFLSVSDVSNTANIFEGAEGMATQQRAAAERTQAGYWVYIPPLDAMNSARAVLRDLQNRGIREVLIISEGEKANAISAGVYNTEGQAQERRDSIRVFGYKTEIEMLYRTQAQYWLDVELIKLSTIPATLWQKVVKKSPNITKTERRCE